MAVDELHARHEVEVLALLLLVALPRARRVHPDRVVGSLDGSSMAIKVDANNAAGSLIAGTDNGILGLIVTQL